MDPVAHERYVGVGNERILANLRKILREKDVLVHPRIPLIPEITATRENLSSIVEFLCEAGARNVSLIPYNPLGIQMFQRLGKSRPPLPDHFMTGAQESDIMNVFKTIIREKRISSHLS
jgi:pyruvate formate lyase activating enzyme